MADKNTQSLEYADREALDAELNAAIGDILSAEAEAKRIIAVAEENVKAIQLDCATREREMREASTRKCAAARDAALKAAAQKAESENAARLASVQAEAAALNEKNAETVSALADKLFRSLGGKK